CEALIPDKTSRSVDSARRHRIDCEGTDRIKRVAACPSGPAVRGTEHSVPTGPGIQAPRVLGINGQGVDLNPREPSSHPGCTAVRAFIDVGSQTSHTPRPCAIVRARCRIERSRYLRI